MKTLKTMKPRNFLLLFLLFFLCFSIFANAEDARDITGEVSIECVGIDKDKIFDDNIATSSKGTNIEITINAKENIGGLYIKFNNASSKGLLNYDTPIGSYGFIHEFVFNKGYESAFIVFEQADICDIRVYSEGTLPEDVQLWQVGNEKTDILLCATHSDDDQLFFAGLLPYYASLGNVNIRVAYFINHFDTYNRTHELLDGLWECGITNYPDISKFPDGYSESSEGALNFLKSKGFTYQDVCNFQKSLLERYSPLVVILHDFDGEYGHGAHILNTKSFIDVCQSEERLMPEKIYVHLYDENPIQLRIDEPLDHFNGLSAFQVSQKAFGHHKSQHWTWFYGWLYGKQGEISDSNQIRSYNPAKYGLYHSRVGEDKEKNCLLENITLYCDREIVLPEIPKSDKETATKKTTLLQSVPQGTDSVPAAVIVTIIVFIVIILIAIPIKNIKKKR